MPMQPPQPYPPQYPQQPPQQYYYPPARPKDASKTVAAVLGILCVLLFIALMYTIAQLTGSQDQVMKNFVEDQALKDRSLKLEQDNRTLTEKLTAAGQGVVTGDDAKKMAGHDPSYWYQLAMQREREFSAMYKQVLQYQQYMDPEQIKSIESKADVYVANPTKEKTNNGTKATLDVVNNSTMDIAGVTGRIYFWNGDEVVHEEVFQVDKLEKHTQKSYSVEAPVFNCTHISGSIQPIVGKAE
jgi:hypothetical protein